MCSSTQNEHESIRKIQEQLLTQHKYERIRYYQDQLLIAEDLQDDADYKTHLQNLHIHALHLLKPQDQIIGYGIALGFDVNLTASEDHQFVIQITPGIAYDYAGQAIISAQALSIPLPQFIDIGYGFPWLGIFDLNIQRSCGDASLDSFKYIVSDGVKICLPQGYFRPKNSIWCWSFLGWNDSSLIDGETDTKISLARLYIPMPSPLIQPKGMYLDFSHRRNTPKRVNSYIKSGRIVQGSIEIEGCPLAWTAKIETSEAAFINESPLYFVNLSEHPLSSNSSFANLLAKLTPELRHQLLGPFVSIESSNKKSFVLSVRMISPNLQFFKALPASLKVGEGLKLPVSVNWIGIEPNVSPLTGSGWINWRKKNEW